jgi:hypothetical protein
MTRLRLVSSLAVAALVAGIAMTPAAAQEGVFMKDILGTLGIIDQERDPIDYRARAPLVVPPASKLPEPKVGVDQRVANWPKDADAVRREAARAERLLPATQREKYNSHKPLTQEEIQRGRIAGRPATAPAAHSSGARSGASPYELMLEPIREGREMAARRNVQEEALIRDGVEPPRRYLTEPPAGLRRPTQTVRPDRAAPAPVESRFGQLEFQQEQARR